MDCLFCKIINKEIDAKILYEDNLVIAIMSAYPKVDGHSLIIPKSHYEDIYALPDNLVLHINKIAKELNKHILTKLNINASMIGYNYGERQQIKHFHMHLLPNYGKNNGQEEIDKVFDLINKD